MCIPARLAGNEITLHRAITRNQILDGARQHMSCMRFAVRRRRPLVEGENRGAFSNFYGFFKNPIIFPKLQNFLFTRHKMEAVVNFLVHEFCTPSFTAPPIVAMTHNLDSNHVLSYNVCQFKIVSFYHIEHNIPRLEKHGALYVGCYL